MKDLKNLTNEELMDIYSNVENNRSMELSLDGSGDLGHIINKHFDDFIDKLDNEIDSRDGLREQINDSYYAEATDEDLYHLYQDANDMLIGEIWEEIEKRPELRDRICDEGYEQAIRDRVLPTENSNVYLYK